MPTFAFRSAPLRECPESGIAEARHSSATGYFCFDEIVAEFGKDTVDDVSHSFLRKSVLYATFAIDAIDEFLLCHLVNATPN